jgi:hypothetical protein
LFRDAPQQGEVGMKRVACVVGVILALGAPTAAQDPRAEWIWDAPNERWVQPGEVRRFVSSGDRAALEAGFAGEASERPAAAGVEQDLTLPGGLAAPRGRIVLRGALSALRVVEVAPDVGRGPGQQHTLGLITFEDGRAVLVDLGPSTGLQGLPLTVGERIVVRAVEGRIDGRPVLMAERLSVAGGRREVDWAAGWRAEAEPPAEAASAPRRAAEAPAPAPDLSRGAGSQMLFRGRVAAVSDLDGRPAAELETEDGRRVVVLIERAGALAAGDEVVVRGRWARVGDRRVVAAEALERR